jgi:hypothetical protein
MVILHSSFFILPSAFCLQLSSFFLSTEPPGKPCACEGPTTSARGYTNGSAGASPYHPIHWWISPWKGQSDPWSTSCARTGFSST